MKQLVIITVSILLVSVIGLRTYFTLVPPPEPTFQEALSDLMPDDIKGWRIKDHDMADSPEASSRVSDFLKFDDAIFRTYEQYDTAIGLYIAYWKPGTASYRWAGAHTPDTCWVVNGWTRNERAYSVPFSHAEREFEPAEFGVYEMNSNEQNVYFWHIVGGRAYSYKQTKVPNIFSALIDIKNFGLNLRKEQFFVRISSNKDFETLKSTEAMDQILEALYALNMDKKEVL
ncbi:MAG: Uncharacterised protein [Bacteroidota bacterium]|nr:MAG: Uncharacterised protein [Bacteroidota bacterium]